MIFYSYMSDNTTMRRLRILQNKLRGTYAVIPTFFTEKNDINRNEMKRYIDWLIDEGIHGIIVMGSNGEFLNLTNKERKEVVELVVEHVNHRVPVVAGTAAEWTDETIYWTNHAHEAGCEAVMIVAPYYSSPSEEETYHHFKSIAENTSISIMVYNNPDTTGIDMSPELIAKLSKIERIDYIKDTTFDSRRIRDILRLTNEELTAFAGIMAFESFIMGAEGWVSVPANLAPNLASKMFEQSEQKRYDDAKETYRKLTPLMHLLEDGDYVQVSKYGLSLLGFDAGKPRAPRLELNESKQKALEKIMDDLKRETQN